MLRIGVLVSGGGTNLQAVLDAVADGRISNASVEVVISSSEKAFALERADRAGIKKECITLKECGSKEAFDKKLETVLDNYSPDLIVLAGFMTVIPEKIIQKYRNKIINIHPSLIPSFCGPGYYGLKVHQAALERGVKLTGATVHFVDEGTDTGPIILQKAVTVDASDTPETLQKKVMEEAEWVILPEAINLIAGGRIFIKDNKVIIGG